LFLNKDWTMDNVQKTNNGGHTCLAERLSCRGSAYVEQQTELPSEFGVAVLV
jgi:hypothetical protein